MVFLTMEILAREPTGLHDNICAEEIEYVPLCATDDSHHRENNPNGKAKIHIKYYYRQPGYHPNHLHKDRTTIPYCHVRISQITMEACH